MIKNLTTIFLKMNVIKQLNNHNLINSSFFIFMLFHFSLTLENFKCLFNSILHEFLLIFFYYLSQYDNISFSLNYLLLD
jgi:hypothetical protein